MIDKEKVDYQKMKKNKIKTVIDGANILNTFFSDVVLNFFISRFPDSDLLI